MNEPRNPDDFAKDVTHWEHTLREWEEESRRRENSARSQLGRLLAKRPDIAHVRIEYDGYDDSGAFKTIEYVDNDGNEVHANDLTNLLVSHVFYRILPNGWELNDGSFGKVEIDVTAGTCHVVHTKRVIGEYTERFEV